MKIATDGHPTNRFQNEIEERYLKGLQDYVSGGGENALGCGYEFGRSALADGHSILEILLLHHTAMQQLLEDAQGSRDQATVACEAGAFLAEALSPYEMTHRGFREAVSTLRHLNETLELEIKRIAHALHDEAGQMLVSVHLALAELERELPLPLQARIGRVKGLLDLVDEQLRRMSHELRPTILDDLGLVPAIGFLADSVSRRTNLSIAICASLDERLPAAVETALYRIVQEALKNASKHSSAANVHIQMDRLNNQVGCSIRDDGIGFDLRTVLAKKGDGGLGLLGMRERLNAVGGVLQIQSSPGQGTSLLINIPLESSI